MKVNLRNCKVCGDIFESPHKKGKVCEKCLKKKEDL
jgi:hypothetical protein